MAITTRRQKATYNRLWFEKIMAILALVNLILVFFDLSYIPLRDFWLQGRMQVFLKLGTLEYEIPNPPLKILPFNITPVYDLVKGIEPERFTRKTIPLPGKPLQERHAEGEAYWTFGPDRSPSDTRWAGDHGDCGQSLSVLLCFALTRLKLGWKLY